MARITGMLLLLVIGAAATVCNEDTLGSCRVLGCNEWRHGAKCNTEKGYKCMCPPGMCSSEDGICVGGEEKYAASQLNVNTGSKCGMFWSCSDDLGPTDCVASKCLCKAGLFYM